MELRCGLNISQELFLHRKSLLRLHACQGVIIHSVEEQKAGGCVCAALGLGPRSASAAGLVQTGRAHLPLTCPRERENRMPLWDTECPDSGSPLP